MTEQKMTPAEAGTGVAPTECGNCGSTSMTWEVSSRNNSGVVEGRLRTGDVESICVLGCDDCSETLAVVPTHTAVAALIRRNAELEAEVIGRSLGEVHALIAENAALTAERDAYRDVLREFQDGRRVHNPHTRQVARDIEQQALARAEAGSHV